MSDTGEAELIAKRAAYIDTLRGLHRRERMVGFAAVLLGAALIVPSYWAPTWPHMVIWGGYALLGLGWALMLYVIFRRTAWRRANPFNPGV